MSKWVYQFNEVAKAEKYAGSWEDVRALLGGKGAGLFDMTRAGVPVPPGFTVTTEVCTYYYDHSKTYPKELKAQIESSMEKMEKLWAKNSATKKIHCLFRFDLVQDVRCRV